MTEVQVIRTMVLNKNCKPKMSQTGDAAYDLKASWEVKIPVGNKAIVPLGVAFKIPYSYCGVLTHRSSMAFKNGLTVSYGLIDSSFDREIKCCIFNHSGAPVTIYEGDRIAQIRFTKIDLVSLEEDSWEQEGKLGFGSSGGYKGE